MKQIPLPQDSSNSAWNTAVVKINEDTQSQYGQVDRTLDGIEAQKNEIANTIKELHEAKDLARTWLDFLSELVKGY